MRAQSQIFTHIPFVVRHCHIVLFSVLIIGSLEPYSLRAIGCRSDVRSLSNLESASSDDSAANLERLDRTAVRVSRWQAGRAHPALAARRAHPIAGIPVARQCDSQARKLPAPDLIIKGLEVR
eukprot:748533-Hanusia_phi.AAC.4